MPKEQCYSFGGAFDLWVYAACDFLLTADYFEQAAKQRIVDRVYGVISVVSEYAFNLVGAYHVWVDVQIPQYAVEFDDVKLVFDEVRVEYDLE